MAKRRKIAIGNWKMNSRLTAGLALARDLVEKAEAARPLAFDVVICPPATIIWPVVEAVMGSPIMVGGQNCHQANHGAYTGEISAGMLADLGCRYVILGHSERRTGQGETDEMVAAKVESVQLSGMTAVLCVGETQEQRASGAAADVITAQVSRSLPQRWKASQLVVAYEPIWAIGSGKQPEVEEILEVNKAIRSALGALGEAVPVAYGGSVNAENAASLLAEPEIDGVLVGGASLNSDGFWAIAEKCG